MTSSICIICKNNISEILAEETNIFLLACKANHVNITKAPYWRESRCTELTATFQIPRTELRCVQENVMAFFCSGAYTLEYRETANSMELTMSATISELLCEAKTMFLSIYLPKIPFPILT